MKDFISEIKRARSLSCTEDPRPAWPGWQGGGAGAGGAGKLQVLSCWIKHVDE